MKDLSKNVFFDTFENIMENGAFAPKEQKKKKKKNASSLIYFPFFLKTIDHLN